MASGRRTIKSVSLDLIMDFSCFLTSLRNDTIIEVHDQLSEDTSDALDEWIERTQSGLKEKSQFLQKLFDKEKRERRRAK